MRRLTIPTLILSLLATAQSDAAALKPHPLDIPVGTVPNGFVVLRNGTEAYVSWGEEGAVSGDKGLIFDVATGRVLREADNGRADGRGVELLSDGWSARSRDSQSTPLVLTEKINSTNEQTDPVRVRDAVDGRVIGELLKSERPLAAARQADGLLLLSGGQAILPGADKAAYTLRFWVPASDKPRWSIDIPAGDATGANKDFVDAAVTLSPDGRWVTAIRDKVVHLIDTATGTRRAVDVDRGDGPGAVGFSPDGSRLYVAGGNYQIAVHGLPDLMLQRRIAVPDQFTARHIVEHEGGKLLELEGRRQTMFLDPATSQFIRHDRGGSISSYRLAWIGNGNILRASKSRTNPVTYGVYKHENGKFRLLYRREWKGGSMSALTWSPNGRCILMSGGRKTMIMGPLTGGEVVPLEVKGEALASAAFARGGRVLLAHEAEGKVLSYAMPAQCHTKSE